MTSGTDRRSVLTGLGALGVGACTPMAREMLSFSREVAALEAANGGRIGVAAAMDRKSVAYRPDDRFNYCSTFKLFLAVATLERVERGEERLDRAIAISAADMISHAPITQPAVGSTLTIEALCKGTVEVSDNPAANILIRELGGMDAWRAWYRSIGDQSTTVDRFEPAMNREDGDKDTITPIQAVANLAVVFGRPLLTTALEDRLRGWLLASPTGPNRIKAGAPADWTVAHKTGTGGSGQTNDIGVIQPPSGYPVGIAIYYDAPASLSEARRDGVIAEATRAALKALGHD